MPDHNKEQREMDLDVLLAWTHRSADADEVPDEALPELTADEEQALAEGEQEFLGRLLSGELDDDDVSEAPIPEEKDIAAIDMEPIGLNRAVEIDDETAAILNKQREQVLSQHDRVSQDASAGDSIQAEVNIEQEAVEVLKGLGQWRLPIDPREIARQEGIELVEDEFGEDFDGRIEYLPAIEKFVIFYQRPGRGRTIGRVNFSLAHELGHYYLHQKYLLGGGTHNSESDSASQNPMERQADEFAAALLMPTQLFEQKVRQLSRQVCTLRDVCRLAENVFITSVTSTARRYCKCEFEACAVILSREGTVLWAEFSADMQNLNMKFIPFSAPLPDESWSAEIDAEQFDSKAEGDIDADVWFKKPFRAELWEEAMVLGRTGLVLTFLSLPDPELE